MESGQAQRPARATRGFAALVLGATSISLGVVAAKEAYTEGADPESVVTARLVVAAALIAPFVPWSLRAGGRSAGAGAVVAGLAAGAALWAGNRAELEGLARLPAGTLVLLLTTAGLWVAAIGWIDSRRVPTPVERFALVAVVGGVAIMAAPFGAAVDAVGVLFGLGSAICFAVFLFALERNPRVSAASGFLLGTIGAAIFVMVTDPGAVGHLADTGVPLWLILAMGISSAVWAGLVGLGLGATDSVTTAIVIAVEPVLVAVLAFFILDEGLSAREILGGAVVLFALTMVAIELGRRDAA